MSKSIQSEASTFGAGGEQKLANVAARGELEECGGTSLIAANLRFSDALAASRDVEGTVAGAPPDVFANHLGREKGS